MAYNAAEFEARKRSLFENFGATGAMRTYSNTISQQRGNRALADLNTSFNKQAPQVVAGYGRSGRNTSNVKSGAFAKAMQEFAQNRSRQTSDAQQQLDEANYGYGLENRQAQTSYNSSVQDLEAEKSRQIAQDAQDILRYRAGAYA
tara:strand:- start:467 stop:904 length:438 start_codon:yes stop_codon:yes gene_type:complete